MHVGIETNAAHKVGTDTNDYHQTNNGQQGLVAVKGIAVDSLDKGRETFSLWPLTFDLWPLTFDLQQLRYINQWEQRRAEDGKSGKQTKVLQ